MAVLRIGTETEFEDALKAAVPGDTLLLMAGRYRLKSVITVPGISLVGAGAGATSIVWSDAARDKDREGRELVTFRTYTLAVISDGVSMRDLAIFNDAGHPETRGQEVALTVYGDDFRMERCILSSTQDTLFLGPLPEDLIARYEGFLPDALRRDVPCLMHFRECLIEGTVDFIFGSGEALFDRCEIRSRTDARGVGYVAAPSHAARQERGFVFSRCRFTAEEGVAGESVYLARPWRDYGLAEFRDCEYGEHISPLGFDKWGDTDRDKTARFYETPPAEGRVPWVRS